MNDKNISTEKYAAILIVVGIAVAVIMVLIFAVVSYAATVYFHMPWYSGLALFLLMLVIWLRKPKGKL